MASLGKLSRTLRILRRWAERGGLQPREAVYVSWTKSRDRLRFAKSKYSEVVWRGLGGPMALR